MKQRVRVWRIKDRTYPAYIYCARMRRAWVKVQQLGQQLGRSFREAYEKARREREMS